MYRMVESPVGRLTLAMDAAGALTALYLEGQKYEQSGDALGEREEGAGEVIVDQLQEYFAGTRTAFDLPLNPRGTEFQKRVWASIAEIDYGQTATYGAIAEKLGQPRSARAVGAATGRNPIALIVPCHRVVGVAGKLTGYAGGLDRKRWLLDFERGALA